MKKLTLLIAMLMATNAWAEKLGLSCEAIVFDSKDIIENSPPMDLKKHGLSYIQTFVIDDEDETVTFETTYGAVSQRHINVVNFTKQGTTIDFVETRGSRVYVRYNLDLVSSVLIEMTMSRREEGDKEISGVKFLCTKTKPLF